MLQMVNQHRLKQVDGTLIRKFRRPNIEARLNRKGSKVTTSTFNRKVEVFKLAA